MVTKAKWQKGNAWKGIREDICRCRMTGYVCMDNFRASCLPWAHSHGQWTGKIEGKRHNFASRNSSMSMRTPAYVQLIKMQSQINVRWSRFWHVANAQAFVWLCFHADGGKISPEMCRTPSQMIEAVRSELSCDRGTVTAVASMIYELIRHQQPLSCGGGGLGSSITSSFSPSFHNSVLCSDLLSSRLSF